MLKYPNYFIFSQNYKPWVFRFKFFYWATSKLSLLSPHLYFFVFILKSIILPFKTYLNHLKNTVHWDVFCYICSYLVLVYCITLVLCELACMVFCLCVNGPVHMSTGHDRQLTMKSDSSWFSILPLALWWMFKVNIRFW